MGVLPDFDKNQRFWIPRCQGDRVFVVSVVVQGFFVVPR